MDPAIQKIIKNISVALDEDAATARGLLTAYIAGEDIVLKGKQDAVKEAMYALCVYTGDDRAKDHIHCQFVDDEDNSDVVDDVMALFYIGHDVSNPSPEEFVETTIDSYDESGDAEFETIINKKKLPPLERRKFAQEKRRRAREKKKAEKRRKRGVDHEADIPVLIVDQEMISLKRPDSLRVGNESIGLVDEFEDIQLNDASPSVTDELIYMCDFCDFVFTHTVVERYQRQIGEKIMRSVNLMGKADDTWFSHLQRMSKAAAVLEGRDYVLPSDVDGVVAAVSASCISLTSLARAEGHTFNSEMRRITESVSDPDRKE